MQSLADVVQLFPPDWQAEDPDPPSVDAREYSPLPYQRAFLDSPSRRKGFLAGLGTGKTATGAYNCFVHAILANPEPHLGLVLAPTYPMLRDSVLPALREVFPPEVLAGGSWDTAYKKQESVVLLRTGSAMLCRSVDGVNFERLRNIRAAWAWLEEASLMKTSDPWDVACARLRQRARRRAAWLTTTPRGQNWVAERFIINPKAGYEYVHATTYDNPYLPPDYIRDLEASYSEEWIRQELRAEILSNRGAVYTKLSDELWPAGNVLAYEPVKTKPCALEVDFGFRNPAVHLVQTVDVMHPETGRRTTLDVIVWELQGRNGRRAQDMQVHAWLAEVQASGFRIEVAYGDPAGDAVNDQTYQSSAKLLVQTLGVPFVKPTRDWQRSKVRGEETVRGLIRACDGSRRLVWAASNVLDRRGRPTLYAPNSFLAHRNLQYPEPKPGQRVSEESLKDGENDHATDATRYRCVMVHGRETVVMPQRRAA